MKTLSQTNNIDSTKSTSMKNLMQSVLSYAEKNGATSASVAANHDCGFSVDVRMGETETIAFSEDAAIGVTVYIGHQKGSASSTDTTSNALHSMVERAIEIAKISSEDKAFGLAEKELMATEIPDLALYHPWDLTPTAAIELAMKCEKEALSLDKRINNSDGVNVSTGTMAHGFANSHGFSQVINSTRHSISCSLIAKQNEAMQRDYDYTTSRDPNLLTPVELLAQSTVARTTSRLGAKKIKTQKVPVLFSSRLSSGLFGSLIGAISGSNLYRGNSFLLNYLEKQVLPKNISVYEQPYLKGALGSSPFDGEGVATRNNVFVENGILKQYVLGSFSARKLGLKTTANSGGVFNLTIDATAGDMQDIIKTMDKGILVTELMGQGVNILTGDYSRGAVGFWVENGEIQYPIEEITIAGNLKNMLLSIIAVGSDINKNSATRCGSVLIDEMMIAGS